mmetsp:Transcript_65007/g.115703  ORF Transcript_65007/g.115703 Transcript_65007/m.115703 type:complete len:87 (-) Transcript_65007:31-291(-)
MSSGLLSQAGPEFMDRYHLRTRMGHSPRAPRVAADARICLPGYGPRMVATQLCACAQPMAVLSGLGPTQHDVPDTSLLGCPITVHT